MAGGAPKRLLGRAASSGRLGPAALSNLKRWLTDPGLADFVPEIEALAADERWDELEDAFASRLRVGTGGIRGPLGPGPNRINARTIGEAAQGLSAFIDDYGAAAKEAGVVVGHEARRQSREFAELSCEVFAANGIRSHLFDGLRSTPEVSFAVLHLGATAGVQITASHNPRTDNGFKFYWSDGGQVVPPHDARFMQLVTDVDEVRRIPLAQAESEGLVSAIDAGVDDAYLAAVRGLAAEESRSARVVFSPMHGAGSTNVLPVLRAEGFDVTVVPEQAEPDERFPTAAGDLINPEFAEVMDLPVRLAEQVGADIAICADPDADRIGVAAGTDLESNGVRILTGNQVGAALTHYILSRRREAGELRGDEVVIETLVTTGLVSDVVRGFGLEPVDDLLVGFKFIAQVIGGLDDTSRFVFAAEESLGYLAGDFVRDKDAAIGALLVCEMASRLKDRGATVPMYLDELYDEYGYYRNALLLVELPGRAGRDVMTEVMLGLRADPPSSLVGMAVNGMDDRLDEAARAPDAYRMGGSADIVTLYLSADRRTRVTVRPSGTEPKLKVYVQHYAPAGASLEDTKVVVDTEAAALGEAILDYCGRMLSPALRLEWLRADRRVV